jgi:hypothetical protein
MDPVQSGFPNGFQVFVFYPGKCMGAGIRSDSFSLRKAFIQMSQNLYKIGRLDNQAVGILNEDGFHTPGKPVHRGMKCLRFLIADVFENFIDTCPPGSGVSLLNKDFDILMNRINISYHMLNRT